MIQLTRHHLIFPSLALALLSAACGSSVDTGGSGGSTTSATTTTTSGVGGSGGEGGTMTTTTTGGGGTVCGGFTGTQCPPDQYCDFPDNQCGAADGSGVCMPKPGGCNDIYQPTCGCDGKVYGNLCDANNAGVDENDLGGCTPPGGMFACGSHFCSTADSYCEDDTSDVGNEPSTFTCKPLPAGCGSAPSCACLANVTCGFSCGSKPGGGLEVTCGGG